MTTSRAWHLVRRPHGTPVPDDFRLVDSDLPELQDGEVLVRNTHLSVDPYMRGRMNDTKSYVPPFALDEPMDGAAVGVVEESRADDVPVGATVQHGLAWRTHAVVPATQARVLDVDRVPASVYLGALGGPGLTAYVGLARIAPVKQGDTVFVSGAAGAVGSMVGQIARQLGATTVIGSAGSPEKTAWLVDELGYDVGLDYRAAPIGEQLAAHGPIDVYFDNVGGDHLEAAIDQLRDGGAAALCGMIAQYDATSAPAAPRNLMKLVQKRLTLRGFIVTDHGDLLREFHERIGPAVASGELRYRETVVEGIENAVDAFLGLATGANTGKMLVAPWASRSGERV